MCNIDHGMPVFVQGRNLTDGDFAAMAKPLHTSPNFSVFVYIGPMDIAAREGFPSRDNWIACMKFCQHSFLKRCRHYQSLTRHQD